MFVIRSLKLNFGNFVAKKMLGSAFQNVHFNVLISFEEVRGKIADR